MNTLRMLAKHRLACWALMALAPLASVEADVIFSDDFEGPAVDSTPGIPPWSSVTEDTNVEIRVRDTDLFGIDNQFVQFSKTTGGGAGQLVAHSLADASTLASLSFDFYDDPDSTGRFTARLGNGTNDTGFGGGTAFQFEFTDGDLTVFDGNVNVNASYTKGVRNRIVMLANSSNVDTVNYAGGNLASNTVDVWLNGSYLMTGNQRNQQGLTLNRLSMHLFGDVEDVDFSLDNVEMHNTILPIPEPGTLMLLGIALGTLTIFRRRK